MIKRSGSLNISRASAFSGANGGHKMSKTNKENVMPPTCNTGAFSPNDLVRKRLLKEDQATLNKSLNLSINDCTCPICLEILIEPVRMP